MRNFQGRRVLVTGAAQGIGRLMAERFAGLGASLIVVDKQAEKIEQTAAEMRKAGHDAVAYVCDVSDGSSILALRDKIHANGGPIHVLVNNAGVVFGGAFLDVPLERHKLTYDVNVIGLVAMTHAFLGDLVAADEGHLVNIASASGLIGLPFGSTYASSKWAVLGFSESIRLELKQLGHKHVRVTTVCPSYINTGMFAGVRAPRLTSILEPEDLADQVIRAVRRNRPFLLTPFMVKTVPILSALLPTWLTDWLHWTTGTAQSMAHWRGHGESTHGERKAG